MFEEIKQAYEVLGDMEKRKEYDQMNGRTRDGFSNMKNNSDNRTDEYEDQFERQQKIDPVIVQTIISFIESVNGCNRTIKYEHTNKCNTCDGSGLSTFSRNKTH